jgi:lipoprotein-anchoring transpeptidase ErfK/SrfK
VSVRRTSVSTRLRFGLGGRHSTVFSALTGAGLTGVIAAVAMLGAVSYAEAVTSFDGSDGDLSFAPPEQAFAKRLNKSRRHAGQKIPKPEKEAAKPQGPLIISVSIEQQKLRVYDANGLFAETPVSTGMRGHSTPMGVFSIIQKHKWHRSNIYSGAPMPYMQRITWSGIAMHAGVLPGYPASHGCIRMPMNFAVRMWGWTRMGARVVVTPGATVPERFSHPLLVAQKSVPVAGAEAQSAPAKSDKITDAKPALKSDDIALTPDQVRTADAGNALQLRLTTDDSPTEQKREAQAVTEVAAVGDHQAEAKPSGDAQTPAEKSVQAAPEKPEIASQPLAAAEPAKDQARAPDAPPASTAKPEPPAMPEAKRGGPPIAVFVSRKDGKLYVRQNFAPLFDVPVAIAPGDRPLGTHIFTAQVDKDDANVLHWSAVSLPSAARRADARDSDEHASRRRKITGAVELISTPPVDNATEALDRLNIPPEAISRITAALSPGGSIIVSDQGIAAGETGEGTDFIIRLR